MSIDLLKRPPPARREEAGRRALDERRERIDAAAWLWAAAVGAAGVAIALLDRVGAPASLCVGLALAGAGLALAGCGVAAASGRIGRFHFAAGALAAPYGASAALAGLCAGAGLLLWPGEGGRAPSGVGAAALGLCLLGAPAILRALRQGSGEARERGDGRSRLERPTTRGALAVIATAVSALTAAAGLTLAAATLSEGAALGRGAALGCAAAASALIVAPGGLLGVGLAGAGAGLIASAGLTSALWAARAALAGTEAPQSFLAQGGVLERGARFAADLALAGLDDVAPARGALAALGLALGFALSPVLAAAATGAPSPREAGRAGLALWPLAVALAAAAAALGALVAPPDADGWRDLPAALAAAFSSDSLSGAPRGFLSAATFSAGLALAAFGAFGLAAAAGPAARRRRAGGADDVQSPREADAFADVGAPAGRRLAASRLAAILGLGAIAGGLAVVPLDPRLAIAAAAGLAAAGLAPPTLIAARRRADAIDATLAALFGLAGFAAVTAMTPGVEIVERLGLAGACGAGLGAAAGLAFSLLRHPASRGADESF